MAQDWIEVNIVPVSMDQRERLLVNVIDGLMHETFANRLAAWFFGWYSEPEEFHLRLRVRWQELERSDDHSDELFALLNKAQNDGSLARWWPGSHGMRGEIYPGETDTYGDLWELSYKDWHSSSELALALVKADPDNPLSQERQGQWNSRTHLHANRLGWSYGDEVLIRAR